jgi:hypothetical protein
VGEEEGEDAEEGSHHGPVLLEGSSVAASDAEEPMLSLIASIGEARNVTAT